MSMTINTQPVDATYCYSPILYNIAETLHPTAGFFYLADVYIWTGAVGSKPATPQYYMEKARESDNSATFEISELVLSHLGDPDPNNRNQFYTSDEVVWVQVNFGYYTTAAGYVRDVGLSNVVAATYGWWLFEDLVNGSGNAIGDKYFLTDNPAEMYVGSNQKLSLSCWRHHSSPTPIHKIVIVDDNSPSMAASFVIPAYAGTSQTAFANINIGTDIVYSLGFNPSKYYLVYGQTVGSVTVTPIYKVYIRCDGDSMRNDPRMIGFINRYGALDYMLYAGRHDVTDIVKRKEMYRSPLTRNSGVNYAPLDRQRTTHSIQTETTIKLVTDYVNEGYDEIQSQLLMSREHWIMDKGVGTTPVIAVQCMDNQVRRLQSRYEGVIQYTSQFRYSFDPINTVK